MSQTHHKSASKIPSRQVNEDVEDHGTGNSQAEVHIIPRILRSALADPVLRT